MKLIIQIPCYNEEKTLPLVMADLPRSIPGIDVIEYQIIDDGSTDRTVEVARSLGVHHIVRFRRNRGLAAAFKAGVDNAIAHGADILVNTDGDNQYSGRDVARLVQPVAGGDADMVIGCRPIDGHPEFSAAKKLLQKLGSWVLRKLSGTDVRDAASGFRAYSRHALLTLNVFTRFSYTMETLIQAGYNNMKVASVDIAVNPSTRPSRLFRNSVEYIWKSGKTMISLFLLYRANVFFGVLSAIVLFASLGLFARYLVLVLFMGAHGGGFWPTLVLSGVLLAIGVQIYMTGVLASLIAANRKLSEEVVARLRHMQLGEGARPQSPASRQEDNPGR